MSRKIISAEDIDPRGYCDVCTSSGVPTIALTEDGYEACGASVCRGCLEIALKTLVTHEKAEEKKLADLIEKARAAPMTEEERREQTANFAFGNLAMTKEWHNRSPAELEALRQKIRKLAGCKP